MTTDSPQRAEPPHGCGTPQLSIGGQIQEFGRPWRESAGHHGREITLPAGTSRVVGALGTRGAQRSPRHTPCGHRMGKRDGIVRRAPGVGRAGWRASQSRTRTCTATDVLTLFQRAAVSRSYRVWRALAMRPARRGSSLASVGLPPTGSDLWSPTWKRLPSPAAASCTTPSPRTQTRVRHPCYHLLVLTPVTFGDCPPARDLFCSRGARAG